MLGIVDRFLSLWIFLAIFAGLAFGYFVPNVNNFWAIFEYNSLNMLLVFCLILMMYGVDGVYLHLHKAHEFLGMSVLPTFICNDVIKNPQVERYIEDYKLYLIKVLKI